MDINSVNITARATKDTELKTTTSGTSITTLSSGKRNERRSKLL